MTFQELLSEVQKLRFEEHRIQSEDYLEGVISKDSLDSLHMVLTAYFGSPLKPEGQSPSGQIQHQAAPFGGIRKDQTMYARQDGAHFEYALLWPWGSGIRITVKVVRSKGSTQSFGLKVFFENLFVRK